ncbi:DegV family protein [Bacillus salinus]|uniref:DegV family protein n=1 Tax=Bacillus sp. HMF5848 TaxID=2495421 RepID=UPI0021AE0823|nr:DegV family protein [Bacillus sp. HMF5848]
MSKVRIITDSASDLPHEFATNNNLTILPLGVHLDEKQFEDGVTIKPKAVYEAMRAGKVPTTSQVSPQVFEDIFTDSAKREESVVYIAFSSELSGTYQTAVMMANQVKEEYPNSQIHIINTKCASLGEGLVARKAAELAKNGATVEEIIQAVEFTSKHMEHIFTVDNLEYLARGGRVSKTAAFVGGLLNIKPLLNVEDGKLVPFEKVRGKKKLYTRIIEIMKERGVQLDKQVIAISHGDDLESAEDMKRMIQEEFNPSEVFINMIGASIGAHAGPGTIAIFFLNKID